MKIISVQRNREPELKEIDGSLKSMQEGVAGYIEIIEPFDDPIAIVVNEEGKINGLPVSRFHIDFEGVPCVFLECLFKRITAMLLFSL